jgi:epoxyqueuosine reductase QueG
VFSEHVKILFLGDGRSPHLKRWLELGMNGEMTYMAKSPDKRLDLRLLVHGARSVISLLHSYYSDKEPDDPSGPDVVLVKPVDPGARKVNSKGRPG